MVDAEELAKCFDADELRGYKPIRNFNREERRAISWALRTARASNFPSPCTCQFVKDDFGAPQIIICPSCSLPSAERAGEATVPVDAIINLVNHQQQCDEDGVMVQVSRQALAEVLVYVTEVRPDNKWASTLSSTERARHMPETPDEVEEEKLK